jgi:hypothetical protein
MEKIINTLINSSIQGVDTYSYNGSTWLIFTETKQWVIELTHSKTLWYNFNFFKNLFGYASLEVVQNQHLITKWVEDNIINGVKHTGFTSWDRDKVAKYALENGIKETRLEMNITEGEVDDIIQDGVKETLPLESREYTGDIDEVLENSVRSPNPRQYVGKDIIDKIIDKGVIETSHRRYLQTFNLEDTIQDGTENDYWVMDGCNTPVDEAIENGIKEVISYDECKSGFVNQFGYLDKIIDKGVIETRYDVHHHKGRIDGVIKNGVKETKKLNQVVVDWIGDIIDNGVKEVHPLPAQDWNGDWGKYYHGKEDKTKPFNEYLNETLEKGVKIN